MKVVVTGANGQLGQSIKKIEDRFPQIEIIALSRQAFDITNADEIIAKLNELQPQAIINAAAYTAVDKAEEEKDKAFAINAEGVKHIVSWAKKNQAKLVHVSTDYVFDGENESGYNEADKTNPISVYGHSKLKGEQYLLEMDLPNSAIVRTSWVFSEFGNNFLKTMVRLGKERDSLSVVNDQIGCPTYAVDLADAILKLLPKLQNTTTEIFHFTNSGTCSWYEFAVSIFKYSGVDCQVTPIPTTEYPTPAKRPKFSVLHNNVLSDIYGVKGRLWESVLEKFPWEELQ